MARSALLAVATVLFLGCSSVGAPSVPRVPVQFRTCTAPKGKTNTVDIVPCDNPKRCPLPHGQTAKVDINFTPNADVTKLTAIVTGILPSGLEVPFPLDNPNGCKDSNIACPLKSGETVTYKNAIYIDPAYPSWDVTVRWRLVDQANQNVVCILVPVTITG